MNGHAVIFLKMISDFYLCIFIIFLLTFYLEVLLESTNFPSSILVTTIRFSQLNQRLEEETWIDEIHLCLFGFQYFPVYFLPRNNWYHSMDERFFIKASFLCIRFPLKAVKVMHTVALRTESSLPITFSTPGQSAIYKVCVILTVRISNQNVISVFKREFCYLYLPLSTLFSFVQGILWKK